MEEGLCRPSTTPVCKTRSKGAMKRSHELLLKFWDTFHISGTVGARNFKFGTQIGHQLH